MKCNANTLKAYARKWHKVLDAAYEMEFDRAASVGYYFATPNERAISVIKGLLDRAMSDDSRIYFSTDIDDKYTGEMVIREVPALYELGNDFSMNEVQNVLRGLNCIARELVYTCICLDLNSATIRDFAALVDFIMKKVEREAAEQEATAPAAEQEQEAPAETETEQATETTAPTDATETPAPLQLETLAAKLNRMDAAEVARTWARNGVSWSGDGDGTVDAATDEIIWSALRSYRAQFKTWNAAPTPYSDAHQTGRTPEIIAAIEAEDVQNLFKAYGVTA